MNPTDAVYIALKESAHESHREFLEGLWQEFEPLADSGFIDLIARNFQQRFWEMYVACTLKKQGLSLESADEGPDLKVTNLELTTWVEAIAPNSGSGDDAVSSGVIDGVAGVDEEGIILRLTGAIAEKHNKYLGYLKNGIVEETEPYVIAVNGYNIPTSETDDWPYYIMKAVYALGNQGGLINTESGEIEYEEIQRKPTITKSSGSSVSTNIFEDEAYKGISAIIYSRSNGGNGPIELGTDFKILINPIASNPIDTNWLEVGKTIIANKTHIKLPICR
ncbi:hypothetical protein OAK98_04580 [Mariniblastus sp.]|nr:hypothetical protein [Mariniblastus sp.]